MQGALGVALLAASALGAGAINAVAGGGSMLTFPALLAAGATPLQANATSTVALVPGSASAFWAYRRHLEGGGAFAAAMAIPSVVGGGFGTWLALRVGDNVFGRLVPWLILGATALFALQSPLARWQLRRDPTEQPPGRGTLLAMAGFQCLVAVYGGFFGAGIGIMMLAALGLLGLRDIHRMNSLKNLAAVGINAVSMVLWIAAGRVRWPDAAVMALFAVLGGRLGADAARRVGPRVVRALVTGWGLLLAAVMLARQLRGA